MQSIAVITTVSTALLVACADPPVAPTPPVAPSPPVAPGPPPPAPSPAGFSVYGSVLDTLFRPIADATVEVIDGPARGASAVTDAQGFYELPGVFSDAITVRASKDGYVASTQTHSLSQPGASRLQFFLQLNGPSVILTGNYTLTFIADPACTELPDVARTRTYQATIGSTPGATTFPTLSPVLAPGPHIPIAYFVTPIAYVVTLSGGTFYANHLFVNVAGSSALFWTDTWSEYGGSDILELLTSSTSLMITGGANVSVGAPSVSASFGGTFTYCADQITNVWPACGVSPITCRSLNHGLVLTRR